MKGQGDRGKIAVDKEKGIDGEMLGGASAARAL